jgi:coproporphyrinogen III oxidase-like Fe-S oxidoreductase
MPGVDPRWLETRRALHASYGELSRMADASRLGYLRGFERPFTEHEVAALWRRTMQEPVVPGFVQNNVYVHIPFCKSICTFCNYERLRPSSPDLLHQYLERVEASLALLAPAVSGSTFHALYVGGGTPSVLPVELLDRLLTRLDEAFDWHPHAGRHFELDPAVMSAPKTEVLARHGFELASFGIQSLDPSVAERHNRGHQTRELIRTRFEELRAGGVSRVSCDMLLGLDGTTPEGILADLEALMTEDRPTHIDVFTITPTRRYVDEHFGGSFEAFWTHLAPFHERVGPALEELAPRHGYRLSGGTGHHMMLLRADDGGSRKSDFFYQGVTVSHPTNILGVGHSARSQLFGYATLQGRDPDSASGDMHYVGHLADLEMEIRTYLVHRLRDTDTIDKQEFRELFGVSVEDALPRTLASWQAEGILAEDTNDIVRLVDKPRRERTLDLLWLVPDRYLEHEVARHLRLDLRQASLGDLLRPLAPGAALAPGFSLDGVEDAHLRLRGPSGVVVRLRVAADGRRDGGIRLLAEPPLPDDEATRQALARATTALRRVLEKNHAVRLAQAEDRDDTAPAFSTEITRPEALVARTRRPR